MNYDNFEVALVRGLFALFVPILLSLPIAFLCSLWSDFPLYVLLPVAFVSLFITSIFVVFIGTMVASLSIRA